MIDKVHKAAKKSMKIIKDDGVIGFGRRATKYAYYRKFPERKQKYYKDILFINGCTLPHPERYRVAHQMEQLMSQGLTVESVFYDRLSLDDFKYYRGFVFFRCPVTETVREFIKQAKFFNKTCFFDIDDLVIDQTYTDGIKYVQQMNQADKQLYDDGVNRMRETLKLCDHVVTTTTQLRDELQKYTTGDILINRNAASDEMIKTSNMALEDLAEGKIAKDADRIIIGYFSGSITHNEDFELVIPALIRLFDAYPQLHLKIAGILDVPAALEPYKERVMTSGFVDWRELPKAMVDCDIILAPLVDTIFNRAKSENKWLEAGLVKVPTVASQVGAFAEQVKDGETGLLVGADNDWYAALDRLITDKTLRTQLGENAHKIATNDYSTVYTGYTLASFVRERLARNIGFVLPSTDISGGVIVAVKHADILRKAGWDVTLIDSVSKHALKQAKKTYQYRSELPGFNVITAHKTKIEAFFDTQVATLWSTVEIIKKHPNVRNRLYFVQNFETDFYIPGTGGPRFAANASYCDQSGVRYVTMSLWCQKWLKDMFGKDAKYVSNGIDIEYYPYRERDFDSGRKIKILVEGDSKSEYKNTDEAFRIINQLDPAKYEISYLSYRKEPKDWYRVDTFYNRIAPEKVGEVYASCDILIKTSILESFSYPPLEMMATGGLAVVVPNGGNVEYLKDGENCLLYQQGDIAAGVAAVERLVADKALRDKLIAGGRQTANDYQWKNIEEKVAAIYE